MDGALGWVLVIKIAVTAGLWSGPLLFLCPGDLVRLGFPAGQSATFLRLLGMAYASLVVNYAFGLAAVRRNSYPRDVVWTGIASNGGACLVLALGALGGAWAQWGTLAAAYMWASLFLTGLITAGLLLFGPASPRWRHREIHP